MADLSVRLFGGFEVRRSAGPSIVFPTRKARALVALLARHPGQLQTREALAAILWPNSAEPEAHGSLRQALKLVRRAIEDRDQGVIVSEGDALVLKPAAVEVDVDCFEQLYEAGTWQALENAAELYRGDFLQGANLADGPFADWALVERQRLHEHALEVFSKLLAHRLDAGETQLAVDAALRLLAFDPLEETVHRQLMQIYLEQGRRGAAIEQYRLCRAILERELGVQPEPETEGLYQEICRHRSQVGAPAIDLGPPVEPAAPPSLAEDAIPAQPDIRAVAETDCLGPDDEVDAPGRASHAPPRRRARVWAGVAIPILVLVILGTAWWLDEGEVFQASPQLPTKPSIAVLPFENLSGDPDQDYFADAFTEDLITDLSRIRDAFVIARRTSFTFKGKAVGVKEVAADLGVRYVLEGSVRRSGGQVRINAQLIDGQTGSHVWSDRYDRALTDVFSVQNNVTGQIAAILKAELRRAESQRQVPTAGLKAWDYALRGNVLLFNPTGAKDFQDAKALLDKALQLDPTIALAWSGLAFVHYAASLRPIPGVSVPNSKDLSLKAAQKAVSLDPKNAEGHWIIGVGYDRNGQPERGLASCDVAMDLNPNNDCAYVCAGLTNMALGKPTEALPYFQHSLRLNPRFRPFVKYTYMGLAYLQSGQDVEAIDVLNRAITGSPNDPLANFALTSALALVGRVEEARVALEKSMTQAYSDRTTIETLRASYSWMGPGFERVLEGLRLAGMPEQ
ncbi:MAG: hypothetical protein D6826_00700 [Alphaproteobacteria bacterium]|nr:MAG: hypothetical protein D6826_00700 [Alphaproteobacteria bacterium]